MPIVLAHFLSLYAIEICYYPRRRGGALSDPAIRPSVRLSGAAAKAIGTLAACNWPATRDVRTADPSADGRRSGASRTAVGGGISCRRPRKGGSDAISFRIYANRFSPPSRG